MPGLSDKDDQYADMNAGAHRRPPPLIGSPSILWHRGFWKPSALDKESWVGEIDKFLYILFSELRRSYDIRSPNIEDDQVHLFRHSGPVDIPRMDAESALANLTQPENVRYRLNVVSCRAKLNDIQFSFKANLRSEFWTLTVTIDFSNHGAEMPDAVLCDICDALETLMQDISERYDSGEHQRKSEWDNLYNRLVGRFRSYCDNFFRLTLSRADYPNRIPVSCGKIFADFVGIVLGIRINETTGKAEKVLSAKGTPIQNRIQGKGFDPNQALRLLNAEWPFVRILHGGPSRKYLKSEERQGSPEYSASLLQRRRILYVSALGRLGSSVKAIQQVPVIYTLISSHSSRWQLGRLVDRLHELGCLRLAAIRDVRQVMTARDSLRGAYDALASGGSVDKADEQLRLIEKSEAIPGGLTNRVERSRYYVSRFKKIVDQMNLHRVEGFQRYDEFVDRRLSDKFELIDQVGKQYAELRTDIRFRLNVQMRSDTREQSFVTNDLLDTAELIITLPSIYYLGEAIGKAFDGKLIPGTDILIERGVPFILSTFIVSIAYLAWKAFRRRRNRRKRLAQGLPPDVASAVPAIGTPAT